MISFTTVFLDEFSSATRNSFNRSGGIWHPQEYAKTHTVELAAYSKGSVSREFFSRGLSQKNNPIPFAFVLKKGKKPWDGIAEIGRKSRILDSGCAYMVVFYRALCAYLGEEKFNALYGDSRFILHSVPVDTVTTLLFKRVVIESAAEIEPGDQCCFRNVLAYNIKHGLREETYVVCSGPNQFMGLGVQGNTKQEVEEELFRQFNEPSHVITESVFKNSTMNNKTFLETQTNPRFPKEGRLHLKERRPLIDRIQQLAETPIEQLSELLEEWGRPRKKPCPDSPSI